MSVIVSCQNEIRSLSGQVGDLALDYFIELLFVFLAPPIAFADWCITLHFRSSFQSSRGGSLKLSLQSSEKPGMDEVKLLHLTQIQTIQIDAPVEPFIVLTKLFRRPYLEIDSGRLPVLYSISSESDKNQAQQWIG